MQLRVALAAVLVLLLAGCLGATTPAASSGTVAFYLSDDTGSIEDFEHLNVTVTKVGFKRAGTCDRSGGGHHRDGCHGDCRDCDDRNRTQWVVRDVPDRTVDLTRIQGKNASQLGELSLPNGTYTKVFIHVGSVNGTLESGENVSVRLPSNRLKIKERFTVGGGESLSFVFDVSVFERDSNRYVIRPVVADSGENVSFTPCGCGQSGHGGHRSGHGHGRHGVGT